MALETAHDRFSADLTANRPASAIPIANPSEMYSPYPIMSRDGDLIPKKSLNPFLILAATSLALFQTASAMFLIPLISPCMMSLPIEDMVSLTFENIFLMPFQIDSATPFTASQAPFQSPFRTDKKTFNNVGYNSSFDSDFDCVPNTYEYGFDNFQGSSKQNPSSLSPCIPE
ncbi:hypothetical protein PAGL106935_24875 [Paenibacillus glucanolyticus]